MSYGELDPIFRLCLAANEDPAATWEILPSRRDVLFSFFTYLMKQGLALITRQRSRANCLRSRSRKKFRRLSIIARKRMSSDAVSALRVWNGLCAAHLLPFAALAPENGRVITNGDFALQPSRGGFDWKYSADPTIVIAPSDTGQGISIDLNGSQADRVALIEQEIPLTPGRQYVIHYAYRLIGPADDSGLHWAIFPANGDAGTAELAISPVLAGQDWQNTKITFSSDRDTARLVLIYRRTLGTVRWKGTVQIRNVTSELAEAGSGK